MPHILLFLKTPRAGFVKTRLARSIGMDSALTAYKALVEKQISVLPATAAIEVHYTPFDAAAELTDWLGMSFQYHPQVEGDLGKRMSHAVSDAFNRGADSVICIGGDCPKLGHSHFEQTIHYLNEGSDLVFGPTEDGGYYLTAMKRPILEIFERIPWSQPNTLKVSLQKAKFLKLSTNLLETLYDVDEASELERAISEGLLKL